MSTSNDAAARKPIDQTSDESNDVIIVEKDKNVPTSFRNIFSQDDAGSSAHVSEDADSDAQNAKKSKTKTDGNGTTKRYDWDMFAEQDIDSNFDVSAPNTFVFVS